MFNEEQASRVHSHEATRAVTSVTCCPPFRLGRVIEISVKWRRVIAYVTCLAKGRLMQIERIAAFSVDGKGGNPAAVLFFDERFPPENEMQLIAAKIGYSETVFVVPHDPWWRVRYFSPQMEIPFCGHATIALGAALAGRHGDGSYELITNAGNVLVDGVAVSEGMGASLRSPPASSSPAGTALLIEALDLFGLETSDLDLRMPPAIIQAGARHLLLALCDREELAKMTYDQALGRTFMLSHEFATIALMTSEDATHFHARNAFAAGGVYEDPATGAAAAAFASYLRDIHWAAIGTISIMQGEDMGMPCRLTATIPSTKHEPVWVFGQARVIPESELEFDR